MTPDWSFSTHNQISLHLFMAKLLSTMFLNFQTEVAKKYSLLVKLNDFSLVSSKVHLITLVVDLKKHT